MIITFNSVELENFKGIEKCTTTFIDGLNTVSGPNGSGKTTIIDAIYWCLFGKNQEDKKKFETSTFLLDGSLKEIDLTAVALAISIDGQAHVLKRTVKKSKSAMFIDDVPKKMNEFNEFVESNMFSPDDFKMFVNPVFFSENLHWEKQRELLMKYFAMPEDKEVLEAMKKMKPGKLFLDEIVLKTPEDIMDKYELEKKTEELKSEKYSNQIELLDEQIENFQGDEDVEDLKSSREGLKGKIDKAMEIQSKNQVITDERNTITNRISKLENGIEIGKLEIEAAGEERANPNIKSLESDLEIAEGKKITYTNDWRELKKQEKNIDTNLNKATQKVDESLVERKKAVTVALDMNLEEFNDVCPTCKQALPLEEVARAKGNLEKKAEESILEQIDWAENSKTQLKKQADDEKERMAEKISANVTKGKETVANIAALKEKLEQEKLTPFIKKEVPAEYLAKVEAAEKELTELKEKELPVLLEVPDVTEIRGKYERINDYIGQYDAIQKSKEKRQQLIDAKKEIAVLLEDIDKCIKDAGQFITYRTEIIVKKVNKKFDTISLKLFEKLKNGKTKETFEIIRKGVPYSEDNATGKVVAGFELLSFLKKSMDINTPVIIDNFERYPSIDISKAGSQAIVVKAIDGTPDVVGSFEVKHG
jgi:DNA repair exonuclease SbcCD ATPase subunit